MTHLKKFGRDELGARSYALSSRVRTMSMSRLCAVQTASARRHSVGLGVILRYLGLSGTATLRGIGILPPLPHSH